MQQPTPDTSTTNTTTTATSNTRNSSVGLARFRSAPATWLEALLEEDDEGEEGVDDSLQALKPTESLTQLLSSSSSNPINYIPGGSGGGHGFNAAGGDSGDLGVFESSNNVAFLRQNSSPADLYGGGYDGFFANYGQEYLSTPPPAAAKRAREPHQSARFSAQLKGEQSGSGQFQDGGVSGYLDLEMDKLLEDSVPCRVRAKRGCATHPRSIAERVRRTRISDRIRKLQDLVPNMDKQTNTADMLDEAVEYVKYLQKQIKELADHQKNCKCSSKEHHQ